MPSQTWTWRWEPPTILLGIWKYNRDGIKPLIPTAAKIVELLKKFSPEDKAHIFALMDAFFAKHKLKDLLQ